MNLLHINIGKNAPKEVTSVIEIPRGSSKKYELDRKTGKFRIDRILPKGLKFPAAYGFIPQTLDDDGDPLDIMILTKRKLEQGQKVKVKPIGILSAVDNKKKDDKILAVPLSESKIKGLRSIKGKIGKYQYFFKAYKTGISIKGWLGKREAYKEIRYCQKLYNKRFK